ncbi:UNVERIFIED_CONTAM: hypothetical protein Sradi_6431900 [Sesamum radiatum]|uniref:Aminotransferase-like plant mobile domain-containing protein n=1 Tax=Sesamum radiatum TaxID=300843 RepID=A0AAW2K4N5_SESRA
MFTYDHNFDIVIAFCEAWCPLINTLLTSTREMSISLRDLHELARLPMTGCLYDEALLSVLELTGIYEKRERFILRSSKYLFYAYHLLQSAGDDRCSHISIDKWVKFWSKKTTKYHPTPPRKEKKTVQPKSTHNPLGDIAIQRRWSTAEEALFAKLYIERSLKEEVYLAAYLACWFCMFVLPGKDINSIRPSTFKMAFLKGNSRRVNLAIPILASIYEGLNTVATSPKPVDRPFKFVDNGHAEELGHNYFVATRSSYLTLRQGGRFIIEPYSPHRFGRQFGPKSIKITLKRKKNEDKQVDGGENNPPHVFVPPVVIECDSQAGIAEASKRKGSSHNLEDEVQSINVGEEYEISHSLTMTPPLRMGLRRKQSPPPVVVSVFEGEIFLFNYQNEFLQRLWSDLLVKISNTPVDFLSSIEDDVYLILESMKSFHKFDISNVEESLNTFFVKVRAYDEARSLSS